MTEKQLFDTGYQVIPGTNPPKYHTKYDSYTDTNLRVLEDSFLKDNVVVYAVAVDINGYLPTHNTKYSIPGGGLNYDRSKRVFKDEVGLAAAMNRMIFSGMFLTLVLVVLAIYISNRISNRVKLIAEEANRVAGGDLTPSNLALDSKDEVGNLSRSFNNMVSKLRDLAEKSQYSARLIDNYTRDLLRSTENVSLSANTVTSKMILVSDSMKKMEDSTGRVAQTTQNVLEDLSVAAVSSQKFLDNMEDSKQAMSVAHNVVQDLEFQVDKVGQFILVKRFTEVAGTLEHVVGELQETLDTIKL